MADSILSLTHVSKSFAVPGSFVDTVRLHPRQKLQAVVDVSLEISEGQTFGLVGESGSGKTTLGRMMVRLLQPDMGEIRYRGRVIRSLPADQMRRIQMVFQNPYSSLNPRLTVGSSVAEALYVHSVVPHKAVVGEVTRLFDRVGLSANLRRRYPYELSGGQRQRVAIARALSLRPEVLIADEAVSSLDLSIRAQVLNLFADLRDQLNLTLIFISHDLSTVEFLCERVAVMYLGHVVEIGTREAIFQHAGHPYTRGLIAAIPNPDPGIKTGLPAVRGELPSSIQPPSGCVFRTRCPRVRNVCNDTPPLVSLENGHQASCFFASDVATAVM